MSHTVRNIQEALKSKGFNPGVIDGIWGRSTFAAVQKFQNASGLTADGIVGPKTATALFTSHVHSEATAATTTASSLLPWFSEARHLVGTKEVLGDESNPVILDWAKDLDIKYPGDDVPWCGLFVAHCIGSTLPSEVMPGNPLGARQWQLFGDKSTPRVGAVMVFWREKRDSFKGHVGFYVGEDATAYQILGGNQSDSVCLTWLAKDRFLSARWPKSAASLTSSAVTKGRDEGLSQNEG